MHLSANYFGDLIKKETGKTASEHIQTKLIDIAKEKVFDTGKTISEIAYELGFQYPQHFSRLFKKVVGVTPNEYRMLKYVRFPLPRGLSSIGRCFPRPLLYFIRFSGPEHFQFTETSFVLVGRIYRTIPTEAVLFPTRTKEFESLFFAADTFPHDSR